jgi:hypothetical protein
MRLHFYSAALSAVALVGAAAQAQIPSNAPFYTDPQNVYVQDDTSQGIGNLNMVLCVIGSMDPGDMVNAGPYIALVDINKCQSKGGGGSNSSATGATNYATAVVNVTRATNNDPMVGKVWMTFTDGQGGSATVYAYLSATQSPTDAPPYGAFRMDYIGKMGGNVGFNGFVNAQAGTISFLEMGQQSSQTALAMSASSTTSGTGSMSIAGNSGPAANFDFAYNSNYFRRSDHTNDECFDRTKANASISVWSYGTYNANDGTRVDQANPGFPILATYSGQTYYGYANYWGINFQGLDLNNIADASPIPGLAVTDQRSGNTTAYNLAKVSGKLTKWTQVATTIAALDGIPFTFGADLTNQTSSPSLVTGFNNWIGQWGQNGVLTVTGTQNCTSNGCVPISFSGNATATVNASFLATNPIMGWSDSLGGNLNIPVPTGASHVGTDPVYYYTQSTVVPGSAGEPTALYCLNQCPTQASLAAFPGGGSSASPFDPNTAQQWFSAPDAAHTVTYSFAAAGLMQNSASMVVTQYPSGSMYAQNGVMTGRLFDTAFNSANCPAGMPGLNPGVTVCEPANPSVYYTWQTGTNQWNQSLWLTKASDGSVVQLDPPQNVPYTVPSGAAYGTYAGKSILLQFNGFGNLFGIPGSCVDPVTNAPANCGPNTRYVPMFSIPDWQSGAPTLAATATTPAMIVKALDAELRLKNLGTSASSPCAPMTLTPMALPSGGLHDPSSSSDSEYLGTVPTVTGAPKVIDGVMQ